MVQQTTEHSTHDYFGHMINGTDKRTMKQITMKTLTAATCQSAN